MKGRGLPIFFRTGWLNVVVRIQQDRWRSLGRRDLTVDRRVSAVDLEEADVREARRFQQFADAFGAASNVSRIESRGRYRRDANELFQLGSSPTEPISDGSS
jgi:hypothetical protein